MLSASQVNGHPVPEPVARKARPSRAGHFLSDSAYNLFVWILLGIYLLPVAFMMVTSFKPTHQLSDRHAPWYPSPVATFESQGHSLQLYHVPTAHGERKLALVTPGVKQSQFIDPLDHQAHLITWTVDRTTLRPYYV